MTVASNGRARLAFAPRFAASAASILIQDYPSRDFETKCAITTRSSPTEAAPTTLERAATCTDVAANAPVGATVATSDPRARRETFSFEARRHPHAVLPRPSPRTP